MSDVFAGVDLGGTTIGGVLADHYGNILAQTSIPTESYQGPEAVLVRIGTLVEGLAKAAGKSPSAVGIGVPGLVDVRRGITRFCPNLPTQWRDIAAGSFLSDKLGIPVFLLNDVRAATLGELVFGHGKTVTSLAFFSLGTGIGGGLVIDGKLRLGPLGAAGELGHMTILPDGPMCGCGNRGCMESMASGPAMAGEGVRLMRAGQAPKLHEIVEGDAGKVTPHTISMAAESGDPGAKEVIHKAAKILGIGVSIMVTAFHPELVVFGGGVAEMGEQLLAPVREEVWKRVKMIPEGEVRIEKSLVGANAGILGAAALGMRGPENL